MAKDLLASGTIMAIMMHRDRFQSDTVMPFVDEISKLKDL